MQQAKQILFHEDQEIPVDVLFLRRKTFVIEVHRDLRVVIRVPMRTHQDDIINHLLSKKNWIVRKLAELRAMPPKPVIYYAAGEPHAYLGKKYPLALYPNSYNSVKLENEIIHIAARGELDTDKVKKLLLKWYALEAEKIFMNIIHQNFAYFAKIGYKIPPLRMRWMKTRWGSLSPNGMTLNIELIKTPLSCIEYVVMHELCHLKYQNHGKGFHALLSKVMPDWKQRKMFLNRYFT